jgi:hypothetical protein
MGIRRRLISAHGLTRGVMGALCSRIQFLIRGDLEVNFHAGGGDSSWSLQAARCRARMTIAK